MYQGVIKLAKELPKMYQNKIDKSFDNIQKVYSTISNNTRNNTIVTYDRPKKSIYTIEQKIYNLFKSPTYIYKIDVIIETDEGIMNKRIVAKNKNSLITIDNEYIPIDKIRDIYPK